MAIPKGRYLAINQCPNHPDFYSISIDECDGDGGGTGQRITPSKCCGRWVTIKRWRIDEAECSRIEQEFAASRLRERGE